MTRLNVLFLSAGLALFAVGCGGGTSAPATDAEKQELNAAMEADMQQMTGQISQTPGEGQSLEAAPKDE